MEFVKNKIIFLIIIVFFLIFTASVATAQVLQEVSISSTPNPLGSGARALGMGNAFIAVADDATAASWNPGGLMQLETPEVSLVLYDAARTEDYTFFTHPESDGSERTNEFNLNYFSAAYPFMIFEKNMIVSLNYQRLYDMNKRLNFSRLTSVESAPGFGFDADEGINYNAEGGFKALSPAYAIQITDDLSFGFALNFWMDIQGGRNGWTEEMRRHGELTVIAGGVPAQRRLFSINEYDEYKNTKGFNFNLGVLWNVNEMITFGAVFKSPLKARMDHSFKKIRTEEIIGAGKTTTTLTIEDKVKLHFPLSYGAGLSFRFSDEFTVAFDFYRTEWGNYYSVTDAEDGSRTRTSPIDGRAKSKSHIQPTTQAHIGAEYLFILEKTVIPARGGIFYDPEPSEDLSEDYYGFSLGTGVSIGDVIIDAAYQYRWGRDSENKGVGGTEADVDHHTFYLSAIYHF